MEDEQTLLAHAIRIAASAHFGQVDKAGTAYILHPLRVMHNMATVDEMIVAVLHDVPEDCPEWPLERLRSVGFGEHIIEALEALTKRKGESKMSAAQRAAQNPIALRVKLADNLDNSSPLRIKNMTPRDVKRMQEYAKIREFLLDAQTK